MDKPLQTTRELPQQAAIRLRKMIVDQNLKPGDRFPSESDLTKVFGVGRSTIREAIKILVAENVVEIKRGKGTYITATPGVSSDPLGLLFSDQKMLLYNLFETRLIVEPQIAFLAAKRALDEDIEELNQILREFSALDIQQNRRFQVLDMEFHATLARSTKNDVLSRFLPSINDSIREGGHKTLHNPESQKKAIESHSFILEAIKNRNPELARKEAEHHIRQTAEAANILLGGESI